MVHIKVYIPIHHTLTHNQVKIIPNQLNPTHLNPTLRRFNLSICRINPPQLLRIATRQLIQSLQSQIKRSDRRIHRKHINRLINLPVLVVQLVAFTTVGTVPALDGGRASDQGEVGEGFEVRVALRDEAVGAIGAGDGG